MSQRETKAYIEQLTPQEQKVLKIAMEHLETSFNLTKSIGFKEWQAQQQQTQAQQTQAQQTQAQQTQAQQTQAPVKTVTKAIPEMMLTPQSKL
jgi:hypothetical protein